MSVIFGCWTSASRKSVKPVVEQNDHLLIYPMAYEGLEQSPNIIYTGAAPNQQVIPALSWCFEHLKGGSSSWSARITYGPIALTKLSRISSRPWGPSVPASRTFSSAAPTSSRFRGRQSRRRIPIVIISTVVGDSNEPFYQRLQTRGHSS